MSVSLGAGAEQTVTGANGRWQVKLAPAPSDAAQALTVKGRNTLEVHDVLVGKVWLCSGQSNMGIPVASVKGGEKEAAEANLPSLRIFTVVQAGWSRSMR